MIASHRCGRVRRKTQDGRRLRRSERRRFGERYFAWLQWQRWPLLRWRYHPREFPRLRAACGPLSPAWAVFRLVPVSRCRPKVSPSSARRAGRSPMRLPRAEFTKRTVRRLGNVTQHADGHCWRVMHLLRIPTIVTSTQTDLAYSSPIFSARATSNLGCSTS
jgi:hypothetical protein